MRRIAFLLAAVLVLIGCAMTPDYSRHSNSALTSSYYKYLNELRVNQESYRSADGGRTQSYNTKNVARLKERLSLIRAEMLKRGLGLPQ